MNVLASPQQLRASFLRWALFMVPLIMLVGFAAGQLGGPDTPWFAALAKPAIYPPPAVFGIVWSILFVMIGLALAIVASAWGAAGREVALVAFAIHFIVNQSWTAVFFGLQDMFAALMILAFGVGSLLIAMALVFRVRRAAAALLLPYFAWLCFATALNYQFIVANPDGGPQGASGSETRVEL